MVDLRPAGLAFLDPRELARLIEGVRPDLREDLISAVELGDPHGKEGWDSEEFREILQQNVARRMEGVNISELLSFQKISSWVWGAGASSRWSSRCCSSRDSGTICSCGRSCRWPTWSASPA